MTSEIKRLAPVLVEAVKREGTRGNEGRLIFNDPEAEKAIFELFKFFRRYVSVYTHGHEITVREAPHVN